MKKVIRWTLLIAGTLVLVLVLAGYVLLKSTAIRYDGEQALPGLSNEVLVRYDAYGIPHIQASSETDAFYALGWVQAQDRLFQMDLLRRLTSGRLAEAFGPELIETDRLIRTLGLKAKARATAALHFADGSKPFVLATRAYLEGVNRYMAEGKLPLEYRLTGLEREVFTEEDIYAIINYMSLGFSYTIKEDALTSYIRTRLGPEYLNSWKLSLFPEKADTLYAPRNAGEDISAWIGQEDALAGLGIGKWWGSNAWVVGPERSESGKVLFANDTHMEYGQPSVWYEAQLSYPGMDFYGHFLPLVPFGVLGHNRELAWGLTIFPSDNVNYYKEQLHPEDSTLVRFTGQWEKIAERKETIQVKGQEPVELSVRSTRHGPIMNDVDPFLKWITEDPVSLWWTVFQFESQALEGMYEMNHSHNLEEFQEALRKLDVVGLYVNYGDAMGNIAWWGTGKIPVLRDSLDGTQLLDGSSGRDEVIRYLDFSENPHVINPAEGFIATANNDPVLSGGHFVQGNYLHPSRIERIRHLLESKEMWKLEDFKAMHQDNYLADAAGIVELVLSATEGTDSVPMASEIRMLLQNWDGRYEAASAAPLVYEKLLYHLTEKMFSDELGEIFMPLMYRSFLYKRSYGALFADQDIPWWDDISTETKEHRDDLMRASFYSALQDLEDQYGPDPSKWKWNKRHTLRFGHALGQKKPLDRLFDVGPFPMPGGENVLNKMEYLISKGPDYPIVSGPTCRVLIDFADPVNDGWNINPTGQSGNVASPYYKDQVTLFVKGEYRKMLMNWEEIEQTKAHVLKLNPAR